MYSMSFTDQWSEVWFSLQVCIHGSGEWEYNASDKVKC